MELRVSSFGNENSLSRQDVDNVLESELGQGDRFRSHKVIHSTFERFGGSRSQAEWPDTVFIAEAQDSKTGNHGGTGEGTVTSLIHFSQRREDILNVRSDLANFAEAMGKDVEPRSQNKSTDGNQGAKEEVD
jgi:hypothetical protein